MGRGVDPNSVSEISLLTCCVCSVAQSCPILCDPHGLGPPQAPLSMGFSRQEYWSVFPFPTPEDLPNPGTEPASLVSLVLEGGFFIDSLPLHHLESP